MHVTILFTGTLFLSAALLFLVEPMIAKIVLPRFGGTPAVWNTCVLFFQAMLLAGYGYAHVGSRRCTVSRQASVHLTLFLAALLCLPLLFKSLEAAPEVATSYPVAQLLVLLLGSIGLPFFVLSATTPLLQHWYAGIAAEKDPYVLYAASNLGSMVALLSYPVLVEPRWRLPEQCALWAGGMGALGALVASCAVLLWRTSVGLTLRVRELPRAMREVYEGVGAPAWHERLHWLALAFVPSSLMLGVTTFLTTDIAPLPLLWVLPLGLYLLSFILVFSRLPQVISAAVRVSLPILAVVQTYGLMAQASQRISWAVVLHLTTFFTACMVCHGALSRQRPTRRHLTEFYLWLSAGSMLGSMFNVLFAPHLFSGQTEYPLALVLACVLIPVRAAAVNPRTRWLDLLLPAFFGTLTAMVWILAALSETDTGPRWTQQQLQTDFAWVTFGLPCLLCLAFASRPVRFGLALGALLLAHAAIQRVNEQHYVLHRERTFFGRLRVAAGTGSRLEPGGGFMRLTHGTTLHGMQRMDLLQKPIAGSEPLSYYHPTSPIGQCFRVVRAVLGAPPVALVGLGTGSLAYYGVRGQEMTCYEIDDAVVRLARNPRFFTFLSDAEGRGVDLHVVVGDARLSLQAAPDGHFGVIVVDAFSSDAIPVHLLTREALQLYLAKLAPDGIIAVHITNRYLDLAPVLGNLASDAHLAGLVRTDKEPGFGKLESRWIMLSRASFTPEFLGLFGVAPAAGVPAGIPWGALGLLRPTALQWLSHDGRWQPLALARRPGVGLWTDHYTPLFAIVDYEAAVHNR